MKNQAESHAAFAKSMNAVSRAIGEVFGSVDLAKTQKNFEVALAKAESMEERMNIFLDMTSDSLMATEAAEDEGILSDDEIDRLIEAGEARPEMDAEIAKGLEDIEKELGGS